MTYYIINTTQRTSLPPDAAETCLPDHQAHIARGIAENRVLCAGPKVAGKGGFILFKAGTRDELDRFIADDPFCLKASWTMRSRSFYPSTGSLT